MAQGSLERFRAWLEAQGLGPADAAWLTEVYARVGQRLQGPLGLGVGMEGGRLWVYLHVPDRTGGLRLAFDQIKRLEDPVGELEDLVLRQLLA